MKKRIPLLIVLLLMTTLVTAVSIYEVQYTNNPGVDSSYPSSWVGKEVVLDGIVTATNYTSGGYYISEPISGAWRGILILDKKNSPNPGDRIQVRGKVHETFGMTCIQDVNFYRVLDRGGSLPQPAIVTTGQLSRSDEAEAYEGVYVRVINVSTASAKSKAGRFRVTDGSGQCSVQTGSFGNRKTLSPSAGVQYSNIVGVVVFSFSEFSLNPVNLTDIQVQSPVSVQNRSWGKIKSIYK